MIIASSFADIFFEQDSANPLSPQDQLLIDLKKVTIFFTIKKLKGIQIKNIHVDIDSNAFFKPV